MMAGEDARAAPQLPVKKTDRQPDGNITDQLVNDTMSAVALERVDTNAEAAPAPKPANEVGKQVAAEAVNLFKDVAAEKPNADAKAAPKPAEKMLSRSKRLDEMEQAVRDGRRESAEASEEMSRMFEQAEMNLRVAKSYGDPHMQNMFGQRFDLMQQGKHTLVQIPRGARYEDSLLVVGAQVNRVGANCQDIYIIDVNVTGAWAEETGSGNLNFKAGVDQPHLEGKWLHFGPNGYAVDLKLVQGKTNTKVTYLNVFVRNLAKVGRHVGGLLGEDSHELEAMPSFQCRSAVNLALSKMSPQADEMTRSVAEVELE